MKIISINQPVKIHTSCSSILLMIFFLVRYQQARSAMYRRLGEPLPHQLANTTQVHLVVMHLHLLSKCHATSTIMRY